MPTKTQEKKNPQGQTQARQGDELTQTEIKTDRHADRQTDRPGETSGWKGKDARGGRQKAEILAY